MKDILYKQLIEARKTEQFLHFALGHRGNHKPIIKKESNLSQLTDPVISFKKARAGRLSLASNKKVYLQNVHEVNNSTRGGTTLHNKAS